MSDHFFWRTISKHTIGLLQLPALCFPLHSIIMEKGGHNMKNSEITKQALIYLFTAEDSSEYLNLTRKGGASQLWSSSPTWLGSMKTILWALVAIFLPLVLIILSSWSGFHTILRCYIPNQHIWKIWSLFSLYVRPAALLRFFFDLKWCQRRLVWAQSILHCGQLHLVVNILSEW